MKRYAKEMMDSNFGLCCSGAEDEIPYKRNKKPLKYIFRDFNFEDLKCKYKNRAIWTNISNSYFVSPVAYQKLLDEC